VVCDCEGGGRGDAAVEEGHFWLDADKHLVVGAIGGWLEEDVSSIVGQALRANDCGGEGDAPQGLDGIDVKLEFYQLRCRERSN